MTPDEIIASLLPDADEFQRIVIAECLRDVEGVSFPPTSEGEQKLMRLGAIVLEALA